MKAHQGRKRGDYLSKDLTSSNDPIELSRVLKRQVNHVEGGNLADLFACLDEVKSITANFPHYLVTSLSLTIFLLVLGNESHELGLVLNHEHLLHVSQTETIVAALGRPGNLVSDGILELFDEEVVGQVRHVLLLLKDFLVRALDEVGL